MIMNNQSQQKQEIRIREQHKFKILTNSVMLCLTCQEEMGTLMRLRVTVRAIWLVSMLILGKRRIQIIHLVRRRRDNMRELNQKQLILRCYIFQTYLEDKDHQLYHPIEECHLLDQCQENRCFRKCHRIMLAQGNKSILIRII